MTPSAAQIKILLEQKFPPVTDGGRVFTSVLLTLAANVENLELELHKTNKAAAMAISLLREKIDELSSGAPTGPVPPSYGEETEDTGAPGQGGASVVTAGAVTAAPTVSTKDATPFPAGIPTSAPPGTRPTPVVTKAPVAPTAPPEDLTPNVQSGPAVNAQPLPSRPNAPANGSKSAVA